MKSLLRKLAAMLLASLFAALPAFAQTSFSGFVAFGDSATDGGNFGLYTNTASQSGHGFGGTWAMQLATKLGQSLTPSNSGGYNYAVAGQGAAQTVSQVNSYLSRVGGTASPTVLYTVLSGINDLGCCDGSTINAVAQAAADNINGAIVSLINAGARNIMWVNLPSTQLSPNLISNQVMAQGMVAYNARWASDVLNLRSTYPGVNLVAIDMYRLWQILAANPGVFGVNTSQSFQQAPASVPHSQASSNPDADYFASWDGTHPTAYVHSLLADSAYAALANLPTTSTYQLANLNSALNLDTFNGGTVNGTATVQATPNPNAASQKWDLVNLGTNQYVAINEASGRVLDVYGHATNAGAASVVWDSNGGTNQRWLINPDSSASFTLTGQESGNVLDVYGWSTVNGATVLMWTPNGGANQKWVLQRLGPAPAPK